MIITLIIIVIILGGIIIYTKQDKFGKNPAGEKLAVIEKSPHYSKGQFQNLNNTPSLAEGYSMAGILMDFLFKKFERKNPVDVLPAIKTDLHQLPLNKNVLVWFGHSSYYMQVDGKRILVDPVLSNNASPVPWAVKAFAIDNKYTVTDLPVIDYLFISHDHYDHLDHETIIALRNKIKKIICGLGVGSHFEHWGFNREIIIEKDWYEMLWLDDDFRVNVMPARHFSGRGLTRNKTLWVSYVLQSPSKNIYIGGDSGYDTHYKAIGAKYGPFDLAILENGQYNDAWPYIHQKPEEVLKAALDLKATRILPVHSLKFALANHAWDEPLVKLVQYNRQYNIPLITPMIGEVVFLDDASQQFNQWWVGLK